MSRMGRRMTALGLICFLAAEGQFLPERFSAAAEGDWVEVSSGVSLGGLLPDSRTGAEEEMTWEEEQEESLLVTEEETDFPGEGTIPEQTQEQAEETEEGEDADESGVSVIAPERIILLRSGSRGDEVRILQLRLQQLGYLSGKVDGIYGPATKKAVRAFQKANDLTADGIAGEKTQAKLYTAEAAGVAEPAEPVDVLAGEWPMLTNLEHPVGEDFLPADLVLMTELCDEKLVKIKYAETLGVRRAVEALTEMLEAAREDGITNWQVSAGYRSYAQQERMLNAKINSYLKRNSGWSRSRARRAALKTVAEPGASEHHLGLSFDVNVPKTSSFAGTKQCAWLHEHCWEYGFIIRYQEGKEAITGFSAEAWHIRFVGVEHSLIMRDQNLCLEEYLEQAVNREASEQGEG
ncbi:MAG: D-alanyl-D-alanine carboxypeptidase family protein [Clostridia bacterium]|nr:D-alanyl-D-alanine carboxypeptidase family protein [Clostridia bacterium]